MLAERSTRIVNSGLPGGGGIRSSHVGFSSTTSGTAAATAISTTTTHHRHAGKRRRPATAYQPSNATVATASGAHIANGM